MGSATMAHVNHDLTGIAGPAVNEMGLEDARRRLG
jgi:hypothetical protein